MKLGAGHCEHATVERDICRSIQCRDACSGQERLTRSGLRSALPIECRGDCEIARAEERAGILGEGGNADWNANINDSAKHVRRRTECRSGVEVVVAVELKLVAAGGVERAVLKTSARECDGGSSRGERHGFAVVDLDVDGRQRPGRFLNRSTGIEDHRRANTSLIHTHISREADQTAGLIVD